MSLKVREKVLDQNKNVPSLETPIVPLGTHLKEHTTFATHFHSPFPENETKCVKWKCSILSNELMHFFEHFINQIVYSWC